MLRSRVLLAAAVAVGILSTASSAQLIICGDVDQNQRINVVDALGIAQSTVGLLTLDPTQTLQADVNADATINVTDALIVAQFVVFLVQDLTCGGTSDCDSPGAPIQDMTTTNVTISVTNTATINGDLSIDVDIRHGFIGDLVVTLIHPDSTQVILHNRTGGGATDITGTYPTTLTPSQPLSVLDGKPANGIWTLRVRDEAWGDQGTIASWCVNLGQVIDATNQTYVLLGASVTGNNLINYPFARLTGGGIPENTIQFFADEWDPGPNRVNESGGGDDILLGPIPGGTWSTTMSPGQGTIDAMTGFFIAGDLTGRGLVDYTNPTFGNAQFDVASVPPDWIR